MVQLLGQAQFRDVRAAIAPDLVDDQGVLPDEVIGSDVYAGSAVREVLAIDPLAGTRAGDEFRRVQTAAILFCAARLAPRVADVTRETIGPYSIGSQPRDFAALADELRYQGLRLLAMNAPTVSPVATYRPVGMALASGGRGDVRNRPIIVPPINIFPD
jgi:hypothetical protein